MNDSDIIYAELFSNVVRLNNFSTIFYFDPENEKERCHMENWLSLPGKVIPLLLWRTIKSINLSRFINAELLVLVCLPGIYRVDLLDTLSSSLRYMRQVKLLIELVTEQDVGLVSQVLEYCLQNHMLNAALIFGDFGRTHTLYSYEAYPHFVLKSQQYTQKSFNLYPDKTIDLNGFQLRTLPDLSEPNTILYHDAEGKPRLLGYVWDMLMEYSRKHNARLELSSGHTALKPLYQLLVMNMARDGIIDVAASIQPMTFSHLERYREFAYPVNVASWCTMVPVEPIITVQEIYAWMIPTLTLCYLALLWLIYELFKNRCQCQRRLQKLGWLFLATFLTCNVQGIIITMFIAPPAKHHINSFHDMFNSKLRIFGFRGEYNSYDFNMRTKYASMFHLSDNITEILNLRNSLNTSYAYSVTRTKWKLYEDQQSHCSRPLFYYSRNLCYYRSIPFALIIPENSPHRAQLNHFMLQLGHSGLLKHWLSRSFYYMVQAGRMHRQDLSKARHIRSLTTQDIQYVMLAFAGGVLISFVLFVCELIIHLCRERVKLDM